MNKFGFVVHPIDSQTFYSCISPWGLLRRIISEEKIKNFAAYLPPRELGVYKEIRSLREIAVSGNIIAIPLLPIQMVSMGEERVVSLIEKSIKYCEKKGASIVGLGGFASVIGNEGEVVLKRVNIPVTSGNTLTASLTLDGIYKAAYVMGASLADCTLAVVGATGDIGSICAKVLSKKVKKLNIAARNEKKLQEFTTILEKYGHAKVETFKYIRDAIYDADIVLTVASAISAIIDPFILKPGAILCDVAIPASIAKETASLRNDILVFEGGLAKIQYPNDMANAKMSLAMNVNSIYGCLAETITLSFEGRFEPFSIGRGNITEEKLSEIKEMAARNGITVSDFFYGNKFFKEEDIDNIKKNADRNREKTYAAQK
jgi:fatty aldehyde-generating acyl-ACP reductase